jgi:hypothetical protein
MASNRLLVMRYFHVWQKFSIVVSPSPRYLKVDPNTCKHNGEFKLQATCNKKECKQQYYRD